MRHRGPAQRRQVHPLQRPDQGRHRGRELSVLHHRAERRHRRAARCRGWRSWPTIVKPERVVPAIVEFVDIAGPGGRRVARARAWATSSSPHIRETDAIVNVVRCFDDENVIHVAGKVDPVVRHRGDPDRAVPGRPGDGREEPGALHQGRQGRRRQGGAAPGRRAEASARRALERGAAGAQHRLQQGRAARCSSRCA